MNSINVRHFLRSISLSLPHLLNPRRTTSKIAYFLTFSTIFCHLQRNHRTLFMIEDEVVVKARNKVNRKLDEFKREYGTQMMSFPDTLIGIKGGCYFMEFLVDQRKCDLFSLLMVILDIFEKNKDNNRIIVKSMNSFKQDNVLTLQVEFEECENSKSSKYIKRHFIIYL